MKKLFLLAFVILLVACKETPKYKKTEEEASKAIFNAIKNKDFVAYQKNLATSDDLKNLWELHANNPEFDGFDKLKRVYEIKQLLDNYDIVYPKFRKISRELFFKLINKVEAYGIDLSKIKYEGIDIQTLMYEVHTNIEFSNENKLFSFETVLYKYDGYFISQGDIKFNKKYSKPIEEIVIE